MRISIIKLWVELKAGLLAGGEAPDALSEPDTGTIDR